MAYRSKPFEIYLIFSAFGVNAYASPENFPGVIVLSGMFCVTSLALVYNIEKCFSESSMGHVGALCIFVLLGAFFLIIRMSMDLLWYIPFLKEIMKYLTWIFALLPSYSLASGLMDIGNLANRQECKMHTTNYICNFHLT